MKTNAINFGLLLFRVGLSGAMLTHGYGKLLKVLAGDFSFGDPIGLGPTFSLILCTLAEFVAPLFLIIGNFFQSFSFCWIFRQLAVKQFRIDSLKNIKLV